MSRRRGRFLSRLAFELTVGWQAVTEHWDYGSGRLFSTRSSDNRHLANTSLRLAIWADGYLDVLAELAPQMDSTLVLVDAALAEH